LILKLYEAAEAGVDTKMIVRGIYCAVNQKYFKKKSMPSVLWTNIWSTPE
jgi:hypothetical protein